MDDVQKLIKQLKDPHPKVRKDAAIRLGESRDNRAIHALIEALGDESVGVHSVAAPKALVKIGELSVPPLIKALKHKNSVVRESAAWVLGKIGDARAVGPLGRALRYKDPGLIYRAAEALGEIKDARAVPPLIESLKRENHVVGQQPAEALVSIGEPSVLPLIGLLSDSDVILQIRVSELLVRIGDARAVPPLIEKLKDRNCDVRVLAFNVLFNLAAVVDIDNAKLSASLQEYFSDVRKTGTSAEIEEERRWATDKYREIMAAVARRKQAEMPKDMLPPRIRKPKGKGKIYRMRRAFA